MKMKLSALAVLLAALSLGLVYSQTTTPKAVKVATGCCDCCEAGCFCCETGACTCADCHCVCDCCGAAGCCATGAAAQADCCAKGSANDCCSTNKKCCK
ncbi:MAG TPA: hypothetical protein PLN21_21160 [Gemmatales bacterium]|nr:hypothetical protein [Gemmatales bacterium]